MRRKSIPLVMAAALAICGVARAEIIAHNGNSDSDPAPGASVLGGFDSPEVDVALFAGDYFDGVDKEYYEMATLELEYAFGIAEPPALAFETVINETGQAWASFLISLQFAY